MKRNRNDGLTKICPCSRRQWSRCTHGWYVNFKHGGTHYRGSLDRLLGRHGGRTRQDPHDDPRDGSRLG